MTIRVLASDLARRIRVASEAAFAKDDAFARHNGWTIEVRRGGLGRTYRDPRFDRLSRCPDCGAAMDAGDLPCRRCPGDGRVTAGRQPGLVGR